MNLFLRLRYLSLPLFLLIAFVELTNAQSVAEQRCAAFGKGQNLSNWLEARWQTNYPTPDGYTFADVVKMKESGIQSLRLPICFAALTDSVAPYEVDTASAVWDRIDTVISWADALQMNVIIDNHHEWDIFNQNWRTKLPRFSHLWSVVAQRYSYLDPNRYTFELLNEPAFGIAIDSLNEVFRVTIDTIRQYTTAHTIIVSPNFSSSGQAYEGYQPFADTNLIYTWHSYDPYQFTHQGFSWASPSVPLGTTFPSLMTMLENAWYQVTNWQTTYHKPVFLGEFGTGVFGDDVSRCNWIEYFGTRLDSFNMPWFYWDWRWDFSMFNSHVVSGDSIIPCFKHALHLYGDTLSGIGETSVLPLQVYPNPVSDVCTVSTTTNEAATLTVLDAEGRRYFTTSFTGVFHLPIKQWSNGIYFVQVSSKGRYGIKRLVVQH